MHHTAKKYTMINPDGETVDIVNMAEFCVGKGITKSLMYKVARGERPHHKGWRKKSDNTFNELMMLMGGTGKTFN